MIFLLIYLLTFFTPAPAETVILVGKVEVYMDIEEGSFYTTFGYSKVFLSDCDLLVYLCENHNKVCDSTELADILYVRNLFNPQTPITLDSMKREKRIY